jgi:adenosylcobinamide-GDP ribazoletransferase
MEGRLFKNAMGDMLLCIGFFTRIPAGGPTERRLADAIWAAPVVGIAVGIFGAVAFGLTTWLNLPAAIAAAAALAATMLITGCLHEDGLADVADGFGGGATRDRKLEIMKDSRIGTFGVLALVLTVLVRWSALAELAGTVSMLAVLVAAHAASRGTIPALMTVLPPARATGLSAGAGAAPFNTSMIAAAIGFAGLLLLGPLTALVAAAALVAWFLLLKEFAQRQIGGQTGDVLGALQQGGEIVVLLVALSIHS